MIRINKALEKFAQYDPTKESKPKSIRNLCEDIHAGKMTLPIFQTYLRWKLEKSVSLLNFQLSGKAAVSPISINIIENRELAVPQVTFLDRKLIDDDRVYGKDSVNDGQQRLSCNYKAFIDHEEFRSIMLDITKGKFVINEGQVRKSQIPVGILYNGDTEVFKAYLKKSKHLQKFEISDLLQRIRNKHMGYYYTVNYAKDLTEEEQREWFEVLNLAGSRVTGVQVSLTEMLVKGVDYYSEYADHFIDRISYANLEDIFIQKSTEISYPLAALNPAYEVHQKKTHNTNFCPISSDVRASHISKLEANEIREVFEKTLDSLDMSLSFIEENSLATPSRMEYITFLIGFFVFNGMKNAENSQRIKLVRWYEDTDFNNLSNGKRRELFQKVVNISNY